mmetsp:Transcript_8544/g.25684  ORF Transcript_8544/g.25684 Transcript_8544/m.25684 type:complete len:231 (-) Transcript_8544:1460-2152(-)
MCLQQARNGCLLRRRTPARDGCWRPTSEFDKLRRKIIQHDLQRCAIDYYHIILAAPSKRRQFALSIRTGRHIDNEEKSLCSLRKTRADRYAHGRLYFVARKHPDADSRVSELFEDLTNIGLKLVLHSSEANKVHLAFQAALSCRHCLLAVVPLCPCVDPELRKRLQIVLTKPSVRIYESTKTLPRKITALLVQPVVISHNRGHDRVCSFEKELYVTRTTLTNDYSHTLGL